MDLLLALLRATLVTIQLSSLCILGTTVVSLVSGYFLSSPIGLVRLPIRFFVEAFRGTSLVVQLFWLYFVLPQWGVFLEPFWVGVVALSLNGGSYGADAVRAALQAVPRGQFEAARALSIPRLMAIRRIILPQALVFLIPPWGNSVVETIKATSAVSLITISELTFTGYQLNALTYRTFEIFGFVIVIYFVLAQSVVYAIRQLEKRAKQSLGIIQ